MNLRRHIGAPSTLLAQCVLGWLLALQPMVAGFAAAQTLSAEHMIVCRGAPAGSADIPVPASPDHGACCLAACPGSGSGSGAPPPRPFVLQDAIPVESAALPHHHTVSWVPRAGLFPQLARAPPMPLSA